MKKIVTLSLIGLLILAFSIPVWAQTGTITTKFAHVLADTHANHKCYLFFADRLKELTKGKLIVNVYPSSQLGNKRKYANFCKPVKLSSRERIRQFWAASFPSSRYSTSPTFSKTNSRCSKPPTAIWGEGS